MTVSVADLSDNKAALKDVTASVKMSSDNSVATWMMDDIEIGRYQLIFNVDSYKVSSPVITVTDKLVLKSV